MGAFVAGEKADGVLVPGDHGTTYGGNPLAGAAVNAVFDQFEKLDLVAHVREVGGYLWDKLEELKNEFSFITAHRGIGQIVSKALSNGLILISAGNNVLRFVPPLVIEKEHVDMMTEKLRASF